MRKDTKAFYWREPFYCAGSWGEEWFASTGQARVYLKRGEMRGNESRKARGINEGEDE